MTKNDCRPHRASTPAAPALLRAAALIVPARWDKIAAQLAAKENVVLLANHQTEADPGVFAHMLAATHPQLSTDVIYVAGARLLMCRRGRGPYRCVPPCCFSVPRSLPGALASRAPLSSTPNAAPPSPAAPARQATAW